MRSTEEFINKLIYKNKYFRESSFKIESNYIGINKYIKLSNKYGNGKMSADSLLKGYNFTINGANDKHLYFLNMLYDKFPNFKDKFEIISKYIENHKEIFTKNKYGISKTTPNSLLKCKEPTIELAIDKNSYFINQAKEIHGDIYDYSLVDYKNQRSKIKIICKEHGIFEQLPSSHLKKQGCKFCNNPTYTLTNWIKLSKFSKNFESYKIYIVKLYNTNESFYKIGRTYKNINFRLKDYPYNKEILLTITDSAENIFKLENNLLNYHKNFKYKPSIFFKGSTECFSFIDYNYIKQYDKEII